MAEGHALLVLLMVAGYSPASDRTHSRFAEGGRRLRQLPAMVVGLAVVAVVAVAVAVVVVVTAVAAAAAATTVALRAEA